MKYDELITGLKFCGSTANAKCGKCPMKFYDNSGDVRCWEMLMNQAADAIEELSKYANTIMQLKSEGWYLQQSKYRDGYAAIATMPFPEPPKEEKEEEE